MSSAIEKLAEARAQVATLETSLASQRSEVERGWGKLWANELGDKIRSIELTASTLKRTRARLVQLEALAAAERKLEELTEKGGGEVWPTGGGAL